MAQWRAGIERIDMKQICKVMVLTFVLLTVFASPAAAQPAQQQQLKDQMNQVGDFLAIVISAVAIPNGAFGVFQYMTAGTDSEQSDKGRKRIRNSFIGVAGATAVVTAVQLLNALI
ncbi:hypothetical protein HISP_16135 [Haloarcula hispanica N601]|uniref:Uncharacterized protein n=2 Tax=Haloarcula hispanica TaxID=51589 RepID=V5TTA5_HALHI|nr:MULTISPECIES: hypothetical protein [Haloarcula]AHB67834.1 hypothetical protein HISP_16135 [Haloarcula hispanica N601]